MLVMARAFAPILTRNGGGVIVNMLSVVSWYFYPSNTTNCASVPCFSDGTQSKQSCPAFPFLAPPLQLTDSIVAPAQPDPLPCP